MFKYGISGNVIIISIFILGIVCPFSLCLLYNLNKNKNRKIQSKIGVSLLVISLCVFTALSMDCHSQRVYYVNQSVKAILDKNYAGYTDFTDRNYNAAAENSFVYKDSKYEWKYDLSEKKLIITSQHENAVFVNGKKSNNEK